MSSLPSLGCIRPRFVQVDGGFVPVCCRSSLSSECASCAAVRKAAVEALNTAAVAALDVRQCARVTLKVAKVKDWRGKAVNNDRVALLVDRLRRRVARRLPGVILVIRAVEFHEDARAHVHLLLARSAAPITAADLAVFEALALSVRTHGLGGSLLGFASCWLGAFDSREHLLNYVRYVAKEVDEDFRDAPESRLMDSYVQELKASGRLPGGASRRSMPPSAGFGRRGHRVTRSTRVVVPLVPASAAASPAEARRWDASASPAPEALPASPAESVADDCLSAAEFAALLGAMPLLC